MTRKNDIETLIKKCLISMATLKTDYQASLKAKEVSDELRVDIKNILENLRSCLDYLAHDIHDKFISGSPATYYFPIRHTAVEFVGTMSHDFAGLQTKAPTVYAALERLQPYKDPWLGKFNHLNNNNKHRNLVEQTRTETQRVTVSSKEGRGLVSWGSGVTFGSGVSIMGVPIDPQTQMPIPNVLVDTKVKIWVDFRFSENNESVIPFLENSIKRVTLVCDEIEKLI